MAFRASQVAVTTSPTAVLVGTDDDSRIGRDAIVKNTGTVRIFLGGATVETTAGFPLDPGEVLALNSVEVPTGHGLFAVVASGTSPISVLQSSV